MKVLLGCEESQTVCKAFRAKGHEAYSCDLLDCSGGHPEWHLKKDIFDAIKLKSWDLSIFFPDCTYLTCSAEWAYKDGPYHQKIKSGTLVGAARVKARGEAFEFFMALYNCGIPKIAIENPIGIMSTYFRKPDQKIQPWQFGENASKGTCLWLKNLPKLNHTKIIAPKEYTLIQFASDMIECPDCGEPYCEIHNEHYSDCDCIGPTQDNVIYKNIDGYQFATLSDPAPKPIWGNQTKSGQNNLTPSEDRAKLRSKTYKGIAAAMADQWG